MGRGVLSAHGFEANIGGVERFDLAKGVLSRAFFFEEGGGSYGDAQQVESVV